jgi:hypothetical protein
MPKMCTDLATMKGTATILTYICPPTPTPKKTVTITVTEYCTATPEPPSVSKVEATTTITAAQMTTIVQSLHHVSSPSSRYDLYFSWVINLLIKQSDEPTTTTTVKSTSTVYKTLTVTTSHSTSLAVAPSHDTSPVITLSLATSLAVTSALSAPPAVTTSLISELTVTSYHSMTVDATTSHSTLNATASYTTKTIVPSDGSPLTTQSPAVSWVWPTLHLTNTDGIFGSSAVTGTGSSSTTATGYVYPHKRHASGEKHNVTISAVHLNTLQPITSATSQPSHSHSGAGAVQVCAFILIVELWVVLVMRVILD